MERSKIVILCRVLHFQFPLEHVTIIHQLKLRRQLRIIIMATFSSMKDTLAILALYVHC